MAALDDDAISAITAAFVTDSERSPAQDLEFAVRQLVEIALRALSPGINDPFTAIAVLNRLGAALEELFGLGLRLSVAGQSKFAFRQLLALVCGQPGHSVNSVLYDKTGKRPPGFE
jgi:hypothetical protein